MNGPVRHVMLSIIIQLHLLVNAVDTVKYFKLGELKEMFLCMVLIIIDIIILTIQIKTVRELRSIQAASNLIRPFTKTDTSDAVTRKKENK